MAFSRVHGSSSWFCTHAFPLPVQKQQVGTAQVPQRKKPAGAAARLRLRLGITSSPTPNTPLKTFTRPEETRLRTARQWRSASLRQLRPPQEAFPVRKLPHREAARREDRLSSPPGVTNTLARILGSQSLLGNLQRVFQSHAQGRWCHCAPTWRGRDVRLALDWQLARGMWRGRTLARAIGCAVRGRGLGAEHAAERVEVLGSARLLSTSSWNLW